ncbi:549_t:CDS:2, partial [Paraglomus occultum]
PQTFIDFINDIRRRYPPLPPPTPTSFGERVATVTEFIPLKDHNTDLAIGIEKIQASMAEASKDIPIKANLNILLCGGAAGIDEIQKIMSSNLHGPNEQKKPSLPGENLSAQDPPTESGLSLLKDILFHLGSCMTDCTSGTYMQTFVSGMVRRAVVEAAEPTGYHIHPLSCLMLTMASRMEII